MSQWLMLDFTCPSHGQFETLTDRRDGKALSLPCPECGEPSPVVDSYAVTGRMKLGEVSQGRNTDPPPPNVLDTRELGDGMPLDEWRAKRKKKRRDERRAWVKKQVA